MDFTAEEMALIVEALTQMPYIRSHKLIEKIIDHLNKPPEEGGKEE